MTSARKGEMNSQIKDEDKLSVAYKIYFSTFILFNASLLSVYALFKDHSIRKTVKMPIIFGCFGLLAYKL